MPKISSFFGIVVAMYFNDHAPPHFHAIYGGSEATFEIATLAILEGSLPKRVRALVLEWAADHRGELAANWDRARAGVPLKPIDPLQ